jgi:precorrin-2 methylase
MVYSTYSYLLERMTEQIETETVPGISSFCQISNECAIETFIKITVEIFFKAIRSISSSAVAGKTA